MWKEGGRLSLYFLILGIAEGIIVPKPGPDVSGLLIPKGKYWERMEEEYSLGDPEGLSLQISSALLMSPD